MSDSDPIGCVGSSVKSSNDDLTDDSSDLNPVTVGFLNLLELQ